MRVTIAEDSGLLREAVCSILVDEGFEIVDAVPDAEALLASVAAHQPDVCVIDVRMPPTFTDEGIQAALLVRKHWPEVGILILSQQLEATYASEVVSAGVQGMGYLLKDHVGDIPEFVSAITRVGQGGTALDPQVVSAIVASSRHRSVLDQLTPREHAVLEGMAQGLSNAGIAHALFVGEGAVEKHITSIFQKLGLQQVHDEHRRVQAVLAYLRESGRL